jgi:natural product biosynthesis luciferase-like monooxygenase protein/amino acid adenylation domain-containing protein
MKNKDIIDFFMQGVSLWVQDSKLKLKGPNFVLNNENINLIKLNKHRIIEKLNEWGVTQPTWCLSRSQQSLWNYQQVNPESCNYNLVFASRLADNFNKVHFVSAVKEVYSRHDILRARIFSIDSVYPLQSFDANNQFDISTKHVNNWSLSDIHTWIVSESNHPFVLENNRLVRFYLLHNYHTINDAAKIDHYFLMIAHHIISDLQSFQIVLNELSSIYSARADNDDIQLANQTHKYIEFVEDEIIWLNSQQGKDSIEYWKNKLTPISPALELPCDIPYQLSQPSQGTYIELKLDTTLTSHLKSFSKEIGLTPFMTILSALKVFIYKHTGITDITICTPFTMRQSTQYGGTVGDFANPVAIRSVISPNQTFKVFCEIVKQAMLEAIEQGRCPFVDVIRSVNIKRNFNDSPLYQIALIWDKIGEEDKAVSGDLFHGTPLVSEQKGAPFEITFTAFEYTDNISLRVSCDNKKFSTETLFSYLLRFRTLLNTILTTPSLAVSYYDCLSSDDVGFLTNINSKSQPLPKNDRSALLSKIQHWAEYKPNSTALIFNNKRLCYKSLLIRADEFAIKLKMLSDGFPKRIGLLFSRSLDICPAVLGIWKIGATYIPLDPQLPKKRIEYLLEDSEVDCLITNIDIPEWIAAKEISSLHVDELDNQTNITTKLDAWAPDNYLAYISYTSGTTGRPKGVMVDAQSLSYMLESIQEVLNVTHNDNWAAITTLSFDISIAEILLPLTVGACVTIASDEERVNPVRLAELIHENNVTIMQATPTSWQMLIDSGWTPKSNLTLISGGESLPNPLLTTLLNSVDKVFNFYGPTETTIWSTATTLKKSTTKNLIGSPLSNTSIYILDESLCQVPPGAIGNIYISGMGVTLGYKNNPILTSTEFLPDPFSQGNGARMYRTGDIGRITSDTQIEFLGRKDNQIKLDGHRIEINEIENCLKSLPNIKEAAVNLVTDDDNRKQLVAFYSSSHAITSTTNMKFSLFYFGADVENSTDKYKLYIEGAKYADNNDLEGVWAPERHFNNVGGHFPNPAVTSAGIATITKNIKIRSGSVVVPLNNPIRIAEEWAVVDNLSGGRAELSVASGWVPRDFVLSPGNFKNKQNLLYEGIDKIYKLWRGETIQEIGGDGQLHDINSYPSPVQNNIPLWLTVTSDPQGFINAGKMGVGVVTHLLTQSIDELADKVKLYYDAFNSFPENADKEPRVALMLHTYLGETLEQALIAAKEPFKKYMRSHIGLLSSWARSNEMDFDLDNPESISILAEHAFKRYTNNASLIGTSDSVLSLVEKLEKTGITEIACLIDWMDPTTAMSGLPFIKELKEKTLKQSTVNVFRRFLKENIEAQLPKYMVPTIWVELDELPKTPNGKIDRKMLEALDIRDATQKTRQIIPPKNNTEAQLLAIWKNAFNSELISVDDDFFELGGNSLTAAQVISDVRNKLCVDVPIRKMFESPTITNLADIISDLSETATTLPIPKAPETELYPTSSAQKRLALLQVIDPSSSAYNVTAIVPLNSNISIDALEFAVTSVTQRHEILRTRFVYKNQEIYQIVEKSFSTSIDVLNTQSDKELELLISSYLSNPFDLTSPPLFRSCMVHTHNGDKLLLWCMHEIIADGYSSLILEQELKKYADSYIEGRRVAPPPLTLQYKDYSVWHNHLLTSDSISTAGKYWKDFLSAPLARPSLPFDFSPLTETSLKIAEYTQLIGGNRFATIKRFLNSHKITLFSFIHSVLSAFVYRLCGQSDIIVGSPILGRDHADLKNMLGFFLNTILIRSRVIPTDSFIEHSAKIREIVIQCLEHQAYPFDKLIEELAIKRERNLSPVTSIFLNVINYDDIGSEVQKPKLGHRSLFNNMRVEMELYIQQVDNELYFRCHYRSALFRPITIEYLINELIYMINQIVNTPQKTIQDFRVFDASRRKINGEIVEINSPYLEFMA